MTQKVQNYKAFDYKPALQTHLLLFYIMETLLKCLTENTAFIFILWEPF